MDRISPTRRPAGKNAGTQRWRDLLFVHFEVPIEVVRPLVPAELELDAWEGRCLVGVVPFAMRDVHPWWAPKVPGVKDFLELNARTYVHHRGEGPGVWFFSLDAASTVAVYAARWGWSLPYHRASMRLEREGDAVRYRSERRFPGPTPAALRASYRVGEALPPSEPGTLQFFLAERYFLYASRRGRLLRGQVHHPPYPLHAVSDLEIEETVLAAAGLQPAKGPIHACFSPGVDVEVFALAPV